MEMQEIINLYLINIINIIIYIILIMSEKILYFYREKDVDIITKNLKKIEEEAQTMYLKNNEPTIDEINNVYNIIKQYIIDNNLIVYGGWAQNALIKKKKKRRCILFRLRNTRH